jgi:hypothetical protein
MTTRILSIAFGMTLLLVGSGILFEPEYSSGASASDAVVLTQTVTTGLAISDCANTAFNPASRSGFGDNTVASASCTWNVKTANGTGFSMTLAASTSPALCILAGCATASFADYTPVQAGTPDFTFSVPTTAAEFAYTVEPASAGDTVQKFRDNGSACGVGSSNGVDTCWFNFSTSPFTVINRSQATGSTGHDEVVKFWNTIGSSVVQQAGTYQATIIATVTDNP